MSHLRWVSVVLLLCTALIPEPAPGQSLSVSRKSAGEYWIEAAAPADTPHVLQASGNLRLWADLHETVSGQLSYRFDNVGVTNRYFRLVPATPPAPDITVVLIGDSTVADLAVNQGGFNGWGQGMYGFFKANARVVNLAQPGMSSTLFLQSDQNSSMLTIKPNYVLVQFGMIEDKTPASSPSAVSYQQYADNLKTIVRSVRGFNGTPILVTPPVARVFDTNGNGAVILSSTFQQRVATMKDVAAQTQTYLIDLNQKSIGLFNALGQSGCAYLGSGWPGDVNHYSDKGAQVIAQMVVNALPDPLGAYLVGIFDPPPKP